MKQNVFSRFHCIVITVFISYKIIVGVIIIYSFFQGVLGTRFESLQFQIGSLKSEKIGSLESEKSGPYRSIPGS